MGGEIPGVLASITPYQKRKQKPPAEIYRNQGLIQETWYTYAFTIKLMIFPYMPY